ncbi:hypothetical protein N0V85_009097 [Neurospora sp. IMI 360204]|nr:hypothetical protein N0V85_009097 [Neurospora sp. IMI 360204]
MAISGSPAVYGAAQPYGGHIVAPYPEAPLMTSPYSVDPAWNPYASIGQPYNAHQGFNSGYATHDHGQEAYTQSYVAAPVYHSPPIYPEGYNNYEGTIAAAVTPPIPVQVQLENVLGYKASTSGVVIANGSYPTTTADTTTAGNKDRSSGLLAMSNVVIAHGSWATTSDKLPPKN